MRIEVEPPKSNVWVGKGYVFEVVRDQALKVGSQHDLKVNGFRASQKADGTSVQVPHDALRVRAGGLPLEVEGRFVTVMVTDTWPHKDGGFVNLLKVIDIELPRFMHKQSARGYTHDRRAGWEDEPPPREWEAETAERTRDRERLLREQERMARMDRPPEEVLRDELEALRKEAPDDAPLYDAKVRDLAGRIAGKRRRRAA